MTQTANEVRKLSFIGDDTGNGLAALRNDQAFGIELVQKPQTLFLKLSCTYGFHGRYLYVDTLYD